MRKAVHYTVWILLASASLPLQAQEDGFYMGAGLGGLNPDSGTGRADFDTALVARMMAGYGWGGFGLELTLDATPAAADIAVGTGNPVAGEYRYYDLGLSAVYRSSADLYVLGRFKVSRSWLDVDAGNADFGKSYTGALGLGAGYRFTGATALELEYQLGEDDGGTLFLGLRHRF